MHLILNSFGTSLNRENEQFIVNNNDGKQVIDPSKVKSISISRGAKISSDAVLLAIDKEIDVMFIDKTGNPKGRVWSVKYGSISTIRKNQSEFIFSKKALIWIKDIIAKKIDNQMALLLSITDGEINKETQKAINTLSDYKTKVLNIDAELINDIAPTLRGWEGAASKKYFETISNSLPQDYSFKMRSQHPAMDIFNCLLNYGYGILYGRIEGALIRAGVDPYLGIFHRDDYNRPVLVFDVIEIFRVWIDFVVISLSRQKIIDSDWYSIKDDGSYWLETLGKRILIQSVNDYLAEIIQFKNLDRSRGTHIELFAANLAKMFLNSK